MDKTLGTMTRIDQAHGPPRADGGLPNIPRPPSPDKIAAAAGLVGERVLAQVQVQAEQLAEHLQTRQRELDRQEAQLNARCLELENEIRTFRLWASDREEALGERERALQQQLASLENRSAEVAATEAALASQQRTTAELAAQLHTRVALQQQAETALEGQRGQLAEEQRRFATEFEERCQATAQRELALVERQQQAERGLLMQRRTLEDWFRRRQVELERQGRHLTTRERAVDQPRWQSWELQQQWTKQRREFLRQLGERQEITYPT